MSNKKRSKKKKSSWKVPNVGAAMRAANARGGYGSAISTKALIESLGKATLAMHGKKPKRKLSKAEKKARKRVLGARAAYASAAARAARLGKKKRSKRSKVAKKKTTRRASPAPAARRASAPRRKKVPTVTASSVINQAAKAALKRWLCEGARRSGCGAGGSRVITGKGSFVRIRPPRFMTSGGR